MLIYFEISLKSSLYMIPDQYYLRYKNFEALHREKEINFIKILIVITKCCYRCSCHSDRFIVYCHLNNKTREFKYKMLKYASSPCTF